jgi:poly(3-hydroxybutyrate) depolymerase
MKPTHRKFVVTAVALVAGIVGVAAQERPSSPMSPMMQGDTMPMMRGMQHGGMMPMMGMGMMGMADHVEGRIAFLKAELKITDAQLSQWNTFADSIRSNAQRMGEMRGTMMQGGMMGQTATAPDRLDRMEKMMTAMVEAVRSTKAALGPLYAVLSDEQKKMADTLLHGPMGMMGSM